MRGQVFEDKFNVLRLRACLSPGTPGTADLSVTFAGDVLLPLVGVQQLKIVERRDGVLARQVRRAGRRCSRLLLTTSI